MKRNKRASRGTTILYTKHQHSDHIQNTLNSLKILSTVMEIFTDEYLRTRKTPRECYAATSKIWVIDNHHIIPKSSYFSFSKKLLFRKKKKQTNNQPLFPLRITMKNSKIIKSFHKDKCLSVFDYEFSSDLTLTKLKAHR